MAKEISLLEQFFECFPNQEVAKYLFSVIEGERIDTLLSKWYPGLCKPLAEVKQREFEQRPTTAEDDLQTRLEAITQYSLVRRTKLQFGRPGSQEYHRLLNEFKSLCNIIEEVWTPSATVDDSVRATVSTYLELNVPKSSPKKKQNTPCSNRRGHHGNEGDEPQAEPISSTLPQRVGYRGELRPDEVAKNQEALKTAAEVLQKQLAEQGISASTKDILDKLMQGKSESEIQDSIAKQHQQIASRSAGSSSETFTYEFQDHNEPDRNDAASIIEIRKVNENKKYAVELQNKLAPVIKSIQRTFEKIKPQAFTRMRRQPQGDSIDIDQAVESYIEWRTIGYYDDRVYVLTERKQRSVFAGLVIDATGSTQGRVLRCEQEAALALTAAIEKVGDDYCGYAFSESIVFALKAPNELFSSKVRDRIAGLRSQGGTPLGTVIRHVTRRVCEADAHTKLMLVLSDGIPNSIPDAHYAFLEARKKGVHMYLLAVEGIPEKQAEQIAGKENYFLFDSAETLAARLPALYRRLTL